MWDVDGGQTSSKVYAAALRERGVEFNSSLDSQNGWITLELTAAATVTNNGTRIQCVALSTGSILPVMTPLVTLTVYGRYRWDKVYLYSGIVIEYI